MRHIKNSVACCEFVKSTDSCLMDDGFIQYVQIPYCSFPHAHPLAFVLLVCFQYVTITFNNPFLAEKYNRFTM